MSPGVRGRESLAHRVLEIACLYERDAHRGKLRRDLVGGLADEVRAAVRTEGGSKGRVRLVLSATAQDHVESFVWEGGKCAQRGGDIRRLRVVDEAHAADRRHVLDAMLDAAEAPQRTRNVFVGDADRARCERRRGGVLAVVQPRYRRLGGQRIVGRELDPPGSTGNRPESAGNDRDVVLGLEPEQPELRLGVRLLVAVAIEVIRLEVHQHGDARMEDLHVIELKDADLADDPRVGLDAADERAQRAADVPGDRDRASAGAQDLTQERRRGRLPVRPRDGEDRVRQEPRAELELVPDGYAACASARDQRCVAPDPGTLHHQIDPLQQRLLLASEMDFDAFRAEPSRIQHLVRVEADDRRASVQERV